MRYVAFGGGGVKTKDEPIRWEIRLREITIAGTARRRAATLRQPITAHGRRKHTFHDIFVLKIRIRKLE